MILHPRRRRAAQELDALPPTEWEEIYRRIAQFEHPHEMRLGYQTAFYSPLAVPNMAALLARTGHFRRTPTRRAYDTGLVMYEIITDGLNGPRAEKMIGLMDRLHGRHNITNDEMLYVLCGLIVCPTRMIQRAGWRPLTSVEKDATVEWYRHLADHMGITGAPTTYEEAEHFHNSYSAAHVAPSPASTELAAATLEVLRKRMKVLGRWARPITVAVIGDDRMSTALGLGDSSVVWNILVGSAFAVRRHAMRLTPPSTTPIFIPGKSARSAYPHGYTLDQIGPDLSTEAPLKG